MLLYSYVIDMYITLHDCEFVDVREHINLLIQQMFIKLLLCALAMQRELYSLFPWTE